MPRPQPRLHDYPRRHRLVQRRLRPDFVPPATYRAQHPGRDVADGDANCDGDARVTQQNTDVHAIIVAFAYVRAQRYAVTYSDAIAIGLARFWTQRDAITLLLRAS